MYRDKELGPIVQRVEITSGMHYEQCKATVTLEVSDSNGGRKDLVVEYPMQGDNHLTMLMKDKGTNRDISHVDKIPIASAILNKIRRG